MQLWLGKRSMPAEHLIDHFLRSQEMKRLWVKGHFESRLVGRSHTVQYGCSQRLASHGVSLVEVHVHFEAPGGQFYRCGGGGGGQGCRRPEEKNLVDLCRPQGDQEWPPW